MSSPTAWLFNKINYHTNAIEHLSALVNVAEKLRDDLGVDIDCSSVLDTLLITVPGSVRMVERVKLWMMCSFDAKFEPATTIGDYCAGETVLTEVRPSRFLHAELAIKASRIHNEVIVSIIRSRIV